MIPIFDSLRNITSISVIVRMVLAFALGAVIGLERSAKNRPAGFRTHILVCVGAAMASLTGHYVYLVQHVPADLTRLGAQVVTGLGFIGAGTIIVTRRQTVKGLTTAAGLWATGIIGLAVGAGFYEGGILGAALVLGAEIYFTHLSFKIRRLPEFGLTLVYDEKSALDRVMRSAKDHNIAITNLHITSDGKTEGKEKADYSAELSLRAAASIEPEAFREYVEEISGVISATIH